jgi:ATP-dependent DNA helicase RecG
VPAPRRDDWDRLVARLGQNDGKRVARLEALGRACTLFAQPPASLDPESPVDALPGLGSAAREALGAHGVATLFDLLWTLPIGYDDLTRPLNVEQAVAAARAALDHGQATARLAVHGVVRSASLVFSRGRRFVSVVVRGEGKASITANWFFAAHGILAIARTGQPCLLVGRVRLDKAGRARMAHPDLLRDDAPYDSGESSLGVTGRCVRPRYPRLGVPEGVLRRSIALALERVSAPLDPVPDAIREREGMPPTASLLAAIQRPTSVPSESLRRAAIERLAFAEGFTRLLARMEAEARGGEAPILKANRAIFARLRAELGFALTEGQLEAIAAISKDLSATRPMRRLLLGDVGTGKTAVALAAAAQCVAAGHQVAILAPTGVLADQYMDAVGPLARATGAKVALVTASRSPSTPLPFETLDVAIGTHALLSESVRFARLGLVIVDEQHRLGVAQRVALVRKGGRPHLLTLSATPIPRTLALALRGELATSALPERPKGRAPVETVVLGEEALPRILTEVREGAERGERAFVVCPRISQGEADDEEEVVATAEETAKSLERSLAPFRVALLHGGQPNEEQKHAMRAFRTGQVAVLVATTVVEVGVDVPEATRMVIVGADRFGMAQLHQLRGRVGRGDRPGRCYLVHRSTDPLALRRLEAVRALSTGDEIARADLALRGAGDLDGTRQSGMEEELLYLDPASPPSWLLRLENDARTLLRGDPSLEAPEHRGLALSVRRFQKALAMRDEAG